MNDNNIYVTKRDERSSALLKEAYQNQNWSRIKNCSLAQLSHNSISRQWHRQPSWSISVCPHTVRARNIQNKGSFGSSFTNVLFAGLH